MARLQGQAGLLRDYRLLRSIMRTWRWRDSEGLEVVSEVSLTGFAPHGSGARYCLIQGSG